MYIFLSRLVTKSNMLDILLVCRCKKCEGMLCVPCTVSLIASMPIRQSNIEWLFYRNCLILRYVSRKRFFARCVDTHWKHELFHLNILCQQLCWFVCCIRVCSGCFFYTVAVYFVLYWIHIALNEMCEHVTVY